MRATWIDLQRAVESSACARQWNVQHWCTSADTVAETPWITHVYYRVESLRNMLIGSMIGSSYFLVCRSFFNVLRRSATTVEPLTVPGNLRRQWHSPHEILALVRAL